MAESFRLENGLGIINEYMPYSRSIAFGIFVRNGSRNEISSLNGVSHFIEHMLFKGTKKRSQKDIAEDMDTMGGEINAYTAKEYTCYYFKVIDENIDEAMELICDMFFNSVFDEKDVEREKAVIYEEIGMYDDQCDDVAVERLHREIWKNSSLGQPILGTEESLENITRDKIVKYFNENYRPENTVISFAGNIDRAKALYYGEKYFGAWEKGKVKRYDTKAVYEPAFVVNNKNSEQLHICMNFEGPSMSDEMRYPLAVLNMAAGGGVSSLLFQKIREEMGLAYSIYSYTTSYKDTGVFEICSELNPANGVEAVENIIDVLKYMKENVISDERLKRLKNQIKSGIILGQEGTGAIMSAMGRALVLRNEYLPIQRVIEKIESVRADDVAYAASKILNSEKFSISVAGNTKNACVDGIINLHRKGIL